MEIKQKLIFAPILGLFIFLPIIVQAHQPVIEPSIVSSYVDGGLFMRAIPIGDPTISSVANYGRIAFPAESDVYVFEPEKDAEIPLELLVPVRPANNNFKPDLFIIAKQLPENLIVKDPKLPFDLPEGYFAMKLVNNHSNGIFYEPFSAERYHRGEERKINVIAHQNYFLAVVEPNSQVGDYSLGVGVVENFQDAKFGPLLKNVFFVKLGLVGNTTIPGVEILGLFLFIAGFVVGLGAVTVIDVLGFMGRHSSYWTEATIRAHKVTKPLIWLGLALLLLGAIITYRQSLFTGVALFQAVLILILILNGLYLTFSVSPKLLKKELNEAEIEPLDIGLRNRIAVSFLISFVCWWTTLFLFVWYIVLMR